MQEAAAQNTQSSDERTDVVIAIITRAGKVLICQRPGGGTFPGYWEFPGGKREAGETIAMCLRREILEELAIEVTPTHALRTIDHDYPRGRIRLHPFICSHGTGEVKLLAAQNAAWVDPQELGQYQFPPANEPLIAEAIEWLNCTGGQ
jgi:8-oxo-dGTP diphosphatase/A/G-specific adenine glycosylase